jgi:hypothetical protein
MAEVVYAGYTKIPDAVYQDSRLTDLTHINELRECKLFSFNYLEGKFCEKKELVNLMKNLD